MPDFPGASTIFPRLFNELTRCKTRRIAILREIYRPVLPLYKVQSSLKGADLQRDFSNALTRPGVPMSITIDGSDTNETASKSYNQEYGTAIAMCQVKYLHHILGQDHRAVQRVTRPILGFRAFEAAQAILMGIELMQMIQKKRLVLISSPPVAFHPESATCQKL